MDTIKMMLSTLMTPIIGVSEYISTASVSYRKEAQVKYFTNVQSTLLPDSQQNDDKIKERARSISELWTND
jgi:nicotinamide mononucleotide (NMN) deamidase PncC